MDFLKIMALALCAVIIINIVKAYKPEYGIYVVIASSILILYFIIDSLKTGFIYISQLYNELNYGKNYLPVVIKVLAIGYITEFTAQLCKDSGESAIASKVELAGKIIIFCVAIPVFTGIIQIVTTLL